MCHRKCTAWLAWTFATAINFVAVATPANAAAEQDLRDIVAKMESAAVRQHSRLCGYSVVRRYTLQNKHLHPNAQMEVLLTYDRGKGKHFKILSMKAKGVARRSLNKLLKSELKTSKEQRDNNAVDDSNYEFTFLGEKSCGNRECYELQLKPRRKTKYFIDGIAEVSTEDYAIVQIVGHLAKSPSFWIKRPKIDLRFEKIDGFWMPSYNQSTTRVLFFGKVDLTIEYSAYRLRACEGAGTDNNAP